MRRAAITLWASRQAAPTRRVAVGDIEGAHGDVRQLCIGIVGRFVPLLDPDARSEFAGLVRALPHLPATGLRHRFQTDRVGLRQLTHTFDVCHRARVVFDPASSEVYPSAHLWAVLHVAAGLRDAIAPGDLDGTVAAAIGGGGQGRGLLLERGRELSVAEACGVLGLPVGGFTAKDLMGRYRELVRAVHPDAGGDPVVAADLLAELAAARDTLLAGLSGQ